MKLSTWAKKNGICYKTAWRLYRNGQLPVPAKQLSTGTILVEEEAVKECGCVAVYARVSSHDQKADLDRQVSRLTAWATENAMSVDKIITEIGSGMNGKRTKLLSVLQDTRITTIVVEHPERLARFGYEMVEACLSAAGRRILAVETGELSDDLVQDMIDVLTSFCARLYGRRSARNRAKRALEACK